MDNPCGSRRFLINSKQEKQFMNIKEDTGRVKRVKSGHGVQIFSKEYISIKNISDENVFVRRIGHN